MNIQAEGRDARRLEALHKLALLDMPPDPSVDRFTRLATQLLGIPVSLVSLVDQDRQFFFSQVGLNEPQATLRETPLSHSFCQYTIQSTNPLVIEDARHHPLVKDNPAIAELDVISYLGIPLQTPEGVAFGAFCAIDHQPRHWTENDISIMSDLAASVMTEIELRSEISKRQQSEQALKEERQLFVAGPTITLKWTNDTTWRMTYVSPNIKEHLGYDAEDFTTGKITYASIVHPEDLERVTVETQSYASTGYSDFEQEYRLRRTDGEYRWFSDFTMILRDEAGEPKSYQGYIRDISDQKKLENTLYQTTARLRSIADSKAAYVVRTDLAGNYTYVNQRFENFYAWMKDENTHLVGMYSLNTIAPIDHDKTRKVVEKCLKQPGTPVQVTLRKTTHTDALLYTLWEFVAITDNQGVPSEIQSVGFDVSEQVVAQNALAESEERYKLISDLMTDFVVAVEVKPDKTLSVEWRTGAYEEITGFSSDPRIQPIAEDMIHPDDLPQIRQDVERTLAGERTTSEYRRRHKDGHTIWLRAERLPIWDEKEQRVVRYYIAERDITKRKVAEQKLRESLDRQNAILEAMPDLMFRMRVDGTYLEYFSSKTENLSIAPEVFIGKRVDEVMSARTASMIIKQFEHVLQTGKVAQFEFPLWIEGIEHTYEARVVPLTSDEVLGVVRNITERKQTEKQLRQANERQQALLQAIPDLVFRNRVDGTYLDYHVPSPEILPVASHEFLGKKIEEVLSSDVSTLLMEKIRQVVDTKKNAQIEYSIGEGDERKDYEARIAPLGNDEVIAGVRDITERKQIEQRLQQGVQRQQALLQAIPDVMYRIRADGTYLDYNAPSPDMLPLPPEEFIGKRITDVFVSDMSNLLMKTIQGVVETKQSTQIEYFLGEGDKRIEYEARIVPLGDDEVVSVVRDITEQKQRETLLLLQNSALQAAANAIVITNHDLAIEWVNTAFTTMTGFSLEDMQDEQLIRFSRTDLNPASLDVEILEILRAGKVWFGKTFKRRKDGTIYPEEQTITPVLNKDGQLTHFISVRQDITEREQEAELRLEQQRLKANLEKEQETNVMIQKAVSSLSHDIRTPLAVIATAKDLLTHYFDTLDENKRRQKLDSIDKQLHFVVGMLDDLVNFVKSNLSARLFHPTPVNLSTLCNVTAKELQETIGRYHQLVFTCDDENNTVIVDETLVNRIVLNLVSNAIKFSPAGSEVSLELQHHDNEIILKVTDQGIGISEDDQEHIFEAFYRAESAVNINGTGLGLNIVLDCVKQHSGTISVESELNKGSMFIVTLPTGT